MPTIAPSRFARRPSIGRCHPSSRRSPCPGPVALAVLTMAAGNVQSQPVTTQLPVRNNGALINATVGATTGTVANPVLPVVQQPSATNRAVVEWSSFNVGSAARVDFQQPNAQSVLLNRVVGGTGNSQIYGSLTANGRIFIVNPFGVYFGGSSQVSVGSLVASSLDLTPAMSDGNYQGFLSGTGVDLAGSGQFGVQTASDSPANAIQTVQGGSVTMLGGGFVSLGGNINAPGGRITAAVAPAVRIVPVGQSGFVDMLITQPGASGNLTVGGLLNASSAVTGTQGGQINLQAPRITTYFGEPGNSMLSADGPAGGGSITLGDANTRAVTVELGSIIRADALDAGNGGSIAVRATYDSAPDPSAGPIPRATFGVAEVYGTLLARGGPNGGNGGRIETSGTALNTALNFADPDGDILVTGTIDARARSATGQSGVWTLDPFNITISNAASQAVNGEFLPIGPGANVRAADISAALDGGTSVEITTGTAATGSAAGDITLAGQTAITRNAGSAATTLTLRAHGNVTLAPGSSIGVGEGAIGPLNLNLFSDLDGNGSGSVSVADASISTAGGGLTISGGLDLSTGFAAANALSPGVLVQRSFIDTRGNGVAGDVLIRGSAAGATASAAGQTGVLIEASSITAGNLAVHGQAGAGTAVRVSSSGLFTDAGAVQLRGVATRNLVGGGRAVGVDLESGARVSLGSGSLVLAGRGDDNGLAAAQPAIGVLANDLRVDGAAASVGRITLAGQSAGSTGPGIAQTDSESPGVSVAIDNDGQLSPVGAGVVIGASAGAQVPAALGLDSSTLRVLTTGAVNLRPLGVDAAGNVVELPATPIVIGAPGASTVGSFAVDPELLKGPGVASGGLSPSQGLVIGSSVQTGLITLSANALPARSDLTLSLQNQGAGSSGIQLGAGNALGNLALLTSGNVNQTGAITAQNLVVQGGTASRVDLSHPGNQFGVLAFDPPQFLSVATQGNLTVDAASALGCDVTTSAFTPVNITNSVAGTQTVLRSVTADLRLNRSITLAGGAASTLDLVTPANFVVGEGVAINGPAGSQWRVWAPSPANVSRGNLQAGNLYGCAFGDTATCSLSGVALPAGNRFMFVDRPVLTVAANPATGVSGQALPSLTYAVSGVANGDAPDSVLGGALATAATSASRPGTYEITQGTLTSPLGYQVQYLGADLILSAPPYDIQEPSRRALQSDFLADQRSDVYGRNLALPFICTAAAVARGSGADESGSDPLASEWGKVRNLPQLSGCLDVKDGGQCAAF